MKYYATILILILNGLVLWRCQNTSNNTPSPKVSIDDNEYEDGTYCSKVTYYNPNTSTKSNYILNVEIEDGKLIKIYFPNGGWLDDSHFTPPELDENGYFDFISDQGYAYTVKITGPECTVNDADINLEENENALTLKKCASYMRLTEDELSEYETKFEISRNDVISDEMCKLVNDYFQHQRQLPFELRNLKELMENGYIEKRYSVGEEGNLSCQTLIVKRRDFYYLLEVAGLKTTCMGIVDFDPKINGWQEIKILENPKKPEWLVYTVRIMQKESDINLLWKEAESFCNN